MSAVKTSYVIGIDLGTTNCGLAYAQASNLDPRELPPVQQFEIPQLVNPGEVRDQPLLPSSLYLQGEADFPKGSLALPWNAEPPFVVGELAKTRGSEAPRRLVASAKSWLCHSGVDRTSAILPVRSAGGNAAPVARGSIAQVPRAFEERVDGQTGGGSLRRAADTGDSTGIVRCGRTRADRSRSRGSGPQEHRSSRRAAGCVLCLDRAASGLARAGPRRRLDSRRRYRRRHHRL